MPETDARTGFGVGGGAAVTGGGVAVPPHATNITTSNRLITRRCYARPPRRRTNQCRPSAIAASVAHPHAGRIGATLRSIDTTAALGVGIEPVSFAVTTTPPLVLAIASSF